MTQKYERFISLDVFRGMTIVFMIIVNTPGSGAAPFWPLDHAAWIGFTPTDLVFPSFLFAAGNAMSFSMKKFDGLSNSKVILKILKRAAIIFLLGYLMYWFPFFQHDPAYHWSFMPIENTRIMGVLQRIALCYLFASLLIRFSSTRSIVIVSILLLVVYWLLLLIFGDHANPYGMLTNSGTYLDKFLFSDAHLYHGEGVPFDPEGVLSTLPAIVNVVAGYVAGRYIQQKGKQFETLFQLMLFGALLITLALGWALVFPVAKKLWTSSFVLLTVGIDLILISALIYIIEMRNLSGRWSSFFTVAGKNPLPIYLFSELMVDILYNIPAKGSDFYEWVNKVFFQVIAPGAVGSLLFAICYMLFCWSFGKILDKHKINIRV